MSARRRWLGAAPAGVGVSRGHRPGRAAATESAVAEPTARIRMIAFRWQTSAGEQPVIFEARELLH